MRRLISFLWMMILCALILSACTISNTQIRAEENTDARKEDASLAQPAPDASKAPPPVETAPAEDVPPEQNEPSPTEPEDPQPEGEKPPQTQDNGVVPYTLALSGAIRIFDGPGYDSSYVQTVGEDGVFTIVEEAPDGEGNQWGKLKSGLGWVDLTDVQSGAGEHVPITADFADKALLDGGNYQEYLADDSEYAVKIAFQAKETLSDVRLVSLEPENGSYRETQTLHALDTLSSDTPFVAGVVYYGDATTYGLSFTDRAGTVRSFAVYISARNGALVMEEYGQ